MSRVAATPPEAMASIASIYGLRLQANVPLAGLAGLPRPDRIDVRASFGCMPPDVEGVAMTWEKIELGGDGESAKRAWRLADGSYYRIAYSDGTRVVVDGRGERIWATWPDALCVEDTAAYLLGPVLGLVLRLRGITCLHASAVAIDDRAIALVGPSGSGKSSTAAAFARMGYPVLTDDIVALRPAPGGFKVEPAYPRVNLWPDSVQSLFGSRDALPRITPTWEKCFLGLEGRRFQHEALPIAAIYFLGERRAGQDPPRIEAVSARDALMALISDTHANDLVARHHRAQEFEALSRLVECIHLRRVTPCAEFARIQELCEAILHDLHV